MLDTKFKLLTLILGILVVGIILLYFLIKEYRRINDLVKTNSRIKSDKFENDNSNLDVGDEFNFLSNKHHEIKVEASPYQVFVSNPTDDDLTFILFGCGDYLLSENFGSSKGLIVTPSYGVSYLRLLLQSAFKPFEIEYIRIMSESEKQRCQVWTLVGNDANGQSCSIPIYVQSYINPSAEQKGFIDVAYPAKIDYSTYFYVKVLAKQKFIVDIVPKLKFSAK